MDLGDVSDILNNEVKDLKRRLAESEARRMEQATEIMSLQADLSTAETRIAWMQGAVEQHWRDSRGHNHCVRNNPRLWEKFGLVPRQAGLPPRDEFEAGCRMFLDELYGDSQRWPDFFELLTSGSGSD